MLLHVGSLAAGLLLLFFGAEWLVRGSAALALRLGLSPLVIGLTVVAFGTSSPELFVSLEASLSGRASIAVGNVVGSNIGNIALILGLTALVRPFSVHRQVLRWDVPFMIGATLLLIALLVDDQVGRLEGAGLFAGLVIYLVLNLQQARRTRPTVIASEDAGEFAIAEKIHPPLWRTIGLTIVGLGVLVVGAHLLVTGASAIAERLGLSEALIGLTIVAIGTSLPELATSTVAAIRGEGDLAVGNVVGSNLFNILGILGLSAVVHPLAEAGLNTLDLGMLCGTAFVGLAFMRSGLQVVRWEGALLLASYLGYLLLRIL